MSTTEILTNLTLISLFCVIFYILNMECGGGAIFASQFLLVDYLACPEIMSDLHAWLFVHLVELKLKC